MTGPLVLGIDGGGSKTLLALADRSGHLVRMLRGGGVNPMDSPGWRHELERLGAEAAPGTTPLAGLTAALPAYGEAAMLSRAQHEAVQAIFPDAPASLLNDVDAAHFGAFAGGPGILILSGSGSMAWALDAQDASYRVGGWGDLIGDEGSAYWIGRRTLSLVSQAIDGRAEAPGLVAALFAHLRLDAGNPQDSLSSWAVALIHPRSAIAALAEPVAGLAEAGDPAALAIIEAAADELARHVATIAARTPGGYALPWSYAGGVLNSAIMREALARRIGRPPLPPHLPPIGGALLHAAIRAEWPVDTAWIQRLAGAIEADPTAGPTNSEASTIKQGEQGHAWKNSGMRCGTDGAAAGGAGTGG